MIDEQTTKAIPPKEPGAYRFPTVQAVMQFLLLGIMSVSLNTIADLLVVSFAAPIGTRLRASSRFRRNQRVASGVAMMGLGAFVAFADSR